MVILVSSPAYTDYEIDEIARCSSHLSFNSLSQYERYHERARRANPSIKYGLRVNPEYSEVSTLLYNPCAPGTRFGVSADKLPEKLPSDSWHIWHFKAVGHMASKTSIYNSRLDSLIFYHIYNLCNQRTCLPSKSTTRLHDS